MTTLEDDKQAIINWFTAKRGVSYFQHRGWCKKADGRLYPPRGNHSMSEQDAIYQYEMARRGEAVPF